MEAVFLTAIHINKVRHLENIEIPLSPNKRKNLILTGKNGSGKTSILNAIAGNLSDFFANPRLKLQLSDESLQGNDYTTNKNDNNITLSIPFMKVNARKLQEKYESGQLVLAYFGDKRNLHVEQSSNIEKIELKKCYDLFDTPAKDLAKYLVNLKTIQAFANNSNNQKRAEEIESWFQRFEAILRMIYDDNSVRLNFNIETFQFTITMDGREPFDFNTMSMGYAAVFDIIGGLIMRMESQHRYDLEGIVLIDEIETHLHVELQRKIVPILTELFSNIQFIMTTHSPFVLSSAQNAVIYDLEKGILVENGLTNLPYEGIVEGYFGADLLSQELREKFDRYRALVSKADLTDEEYAQAAELEMYLDEIPDYLALGITAEYNRLKLEFENRG